jgi:uncharacterized protein (DUF1330 family)
MQIPKQILIITLIAFNIAACSNSKKSSRSKTSETMKKNQVEETVSSESEKAVVFFLSVKNPDETDAYNRYSAASHELLTEAGVTTIGMYNIDTTVFGDCAGQTFGYAESLTEKTLIDVFNSDAYKELIPIRNKAFTSMNIFIGTWNELGHTNELVSEKESLFLTVGSINSKELDAYNTYVDNSEKAATSYGIKTLLSFKINKQIAGECTADFIWLKEGNDDSVWGALSQDENYKKWIPFRDKGIKSMNGYIITEK